MKPSRILSTCLALPLLLAVTGCELVTPTDPGNVVTCSGFSDWETSPYVLPYPVGRSYFVSKGACDGAFTGAHRGVNRYGNDFDMPKGTTVIAARGGVVSLVNAGGGWLTIDHGDGTWGSYFHLEPTGNLVEVGDVVAQGDEIALSGSTGTGHPHLHFHLKPCGDGACDSIAVNYRNTDPNPLGVRSGRFYEAR